MLVGENRPFSPEAICACLYVVSVRKSRRVAYREARRFLASLLLTTFLFINLLFSWQFFHLK